jgi:hypothetical protein
MPNPPGSKRGAHLKKYQFKKGHPGNKGRPLGSKNKLAETFIAGLVKSFERDGQDAIDRVMAEDPAAYLRVIASILPREIDIDVKAVRMVIHAQPEPLSTLEWQKKHSLIELKPEPVLSGDRNPGRKQH